MFTLANQPQGIGRLLDNGFRLFRDGLKGALGIMLIMIGGGIVLSIVLGLVIGVMGSMFRGANGAPALTHLTLGPLLIIIIMGLIGGLFMAFFINAMILNYANIAYQRTPGMGSALSGAYARLFPTFGAMIVQFLLLFLVLIPSIVYEIYSVKNMVISGTSIITIQLVTSILKIPYYLFAVTFSFTVYRCVIDQFGPVASVFGSHKLVWGNFWRTTLWLLIIYVIVFVLFLVVLIPTFGGGVLLGHGFHNLATSSIILGILFMIILFMFTMPFMTAMTIPYYHDLKLRKEGGDLAARINI